MATATFQQTDVLANVVSGNPYNGATDHANLLALSALHVAPYVPSEQRVYFDSGTAKNILIFQLRPDDEYDWQAGTLRVPLNVIEADAACSLTNFNIYRIDNDGQQIESLATGIFIGETMTAGVHNLDMPVTAADAAPSDEILVILRGNASSNKSIVILPDQEVSSPLHRIVRGRLSAVGTGTFGPLPMPRLYSTGIGSITFVGRNRLLSTGTGAMKLTPDWITGVEPFDQGVVLFEAIEPPIDLSGALVPGGFDEAESGQPQAGETIHFPLIFLYVYSDTGEIEPSAFPGDQPFAEPAIVAGDVYFPKSQE